MREKRGNPGVTPAPPSGTTEVLNIAKRVRACRACSLRRACNGPVPGVGRAGAKVMVVEQAPNWVDDKEQVTYAGSGGQLVLGALRRHGFNESELYLTYLIHCFPNKVKAKKGGVPEFAVVRCRDYLRQEYEAVQPLVILALGATVMKFLGIKGGINQNNGKVFHTAWGPVIPLLAPGGLMKRMNDTPKFITQVAAIRTFLDGGQSPPPYLEEDKWTA